MELLARMQSALRLKSETDQRTAQAHELRVLTEQLNHEQHRSDRLLLDLHTERQRSDQLLLNILPAPIAARLKDGERVIADSYDDVTVLFTDLVDFTVMAGTMEPSRLVTLLNEVFSCFDAMVEAHGLEKIKTIGDAYMVVGGLLHDNPQHVESMAELALAMQTMLQTGVSGWPPIRARIGMHCGPVTAGIIGTKKFMYDLWGDTVNIASRMEMHGLPGQIHVSEAIYARLGARYRCISRGTLEVKGKGLMTTYLLTRDEGHERTGQLFAATG
jgi:class 3 adenylate cyclase